MQRSIISPACSSPAKIRSISPAGWCAWRSRTSASPIPQAFDQALAAKEAFDFLGTPEGELALAQATIYLATAPKSNAGYVAFGGRCSGPGKRVR